MKARLQRIREYLSGNNAWLYVLPMVVMALIWVKESDVKNWKVFLLSLLFGGFFFGSALWRAWRKDQQTSSNSKLGWWISVVVLPTVLMLSLVGISRGDWGFFYFWSYGMGVLLAIEGFQYFQQVRAWSFNWAAWVARFNLEVAILVVLVVLAGFIPFTYNPLQEHLRDVPFSQSWPTYALYSLKIFGVLLLFYGYYFLNHYVLIPALLQKRGLAYYLLGLVLSLLVLYPLTGEIIHRLLADDLIQSTLLTGNVFTTDGYFFAPLLVILATLPFIITYRLLLQQQELNLLKKEKTTTELNWLKQQINPHFFFNTLNNLYALSLTKDEQTPEVILQLSELMRYVIYKGQEDRVPLDEEIRYIEDFIRLQRLRLHQQIDVTFERDIRVEALKLPPLLFITFVENAFKHGIEPAEGPSYLKLSLVVTEQELTFTCQNPRIKNLEGEPGIGLQNLEQRLALQFPDRYELTTKRLPGSFKASLNIKGL